MPEADVELPEAFKLTEAEKTHQELRRDLYLERRSHIENAFTEKPPTRDIIDLPDDSKIKVMSLIDQIPDGLKTENKTGTLRIALYVPTLWYSDIPQPTDYRENRLATTILSGDVDVAIQLKADGLNNKAYLNEDGTGAGESKVAATAVEVLKQKLEKLGLSEKDIEFSVLGYSEGSVEGASIAAEILKKGLGKMKEYVSIGGGGLIGAEDQRQARPVDFAIDAIKSAINKSVEPDGEKSVAPGTGKTVLITEGPDEYYIPAEILGGKSGGLENAIGKSPEPPIQEAFKPEFVFAQRYINTEFGLSEDNPIPTERLKAATTVNRDYEYLAEHSVPIIIFTETKDTFFDNKKVKPAAKKLKAQYPNDRIGIISSNSGHDDPWKNPSGLAYALDVIRSKMGLE